uniref:Uncharacterized protein n=1 Tax=Romanomermis culicivorax TaxID=13658 RepID=A0A915L1R2_ROMCU
MWMTCGDISGWIKCGSGLHMSSGSGLHMSNSSNDSVMYLVNNLETQPCETRNCLEIWHGLRPCLANSTIFSRNGIGNGRPLQ